MRIIVAGGAGLIGRPLVAGLAVDGHDVVVLSRRPERADLPTGARAVAWDGRTTDGWGPMVDGAGAVINLAGEGLASGLWTAARRRRILESRTRSTRAIVEAIAHATARPEVLLQASAVGYYGLRGEEVLTEDSSPGQGFLADVCTAWETASEPVEALGVRRVLLRTGGIVMSARGGALPLLALPFKLMAGGPVGDGRQFVPWIHEEDETAAIRFLLTRSDLSGPFNLCAPEPARNAELGRAVARALGRPFWLPTPAFALRLVLGELADVVLGSVRAVPARLLASGFAFRHADLDSALQDLLGRE